MSRQGISSRMEHPPLHRGENPVPQETPTTPHVQPVIASPRRPEPKKRFNLNKKPLVIGVVAAAIIILVLIIGGLLFRKSDGLGEIDGNKYQAVFFTNNQVYFGKLHPLAGGYMKLTDIFYLQTKKKDSNSLQEGNQEDEPGVNLVKLGDELHGPEDAMIFTKEQVFFFENLKEDSKVSQTIKGYKPS